MKTRILCVFSMLLTAVLCSAQTSPSSSAVPQEIPVFDVTAIDKTIDPCLDFYQYACGTWMKNNPIPPDKARWGRFDELFERNLYILRDILTEAQTPGKHTATESMVGAFYGSCMDESAIEKKGNAPLTPELERIHGIKTKADLIRQVAAMHRNSTPVLFAFHSQPDMHDSTETIAYLDQGGITLPDRDYYLKDDPKSVETRQKYVEHVQKMFELAGDKPEVAAAEAKTVLTVETGLAQASMDRTVRRDPKTRDHKMTVAEIADLAPNFDLTVYFADNGGLKLAYMALNSIIDDTPVKPIDGYTAAQRYFLAYGQIWCQNVTDQEARKRVLTDSHSPGRWRVNGAVQNSAAFQQAFKCKPGQPMVAENACRVW